MRIKKTAAVTFKVLVFLVFAAGLFIFISVIATRGQGVPSFFGFSFLNVRTQSMEPLYPVGTVVVTRKTDPSSLKKGDIISFYSQDPDIKGIPNTHRIHSIEKKDSGEIYFITKGDNNDVPDQYPVYPSNVIGVVTGSIHSLGKVINLLNSRAVLFFIIILPLAVLMIFEAKSIGKMLKGKGNEPEEDKKNETTKTPEGPENCENPEPPAPDP